MTAYVLKCDTREIQICSDSLTYTVLGEPLGWVDKVHPLPRLRAGFFCRGQRGIAVSAMATVALRYDLRTFDDVAGALPEILTEITYTAAAEEGVDDIDNLLLFEGFLAGWSPAEKRMRVFEYMNYKGYEKTLHDVIGWSASPTLEPEYVPKITGMTTEQKMIAVMHAHREVFRATVGRVSLGGDIMCTTINEKGVSTRMIGRFADHAEHGHAAAAVQARIARGDHEIDYNQAFTKIEDTIRPGETAGDRTPTLTRQQRRAAARRAA